MKARLSRAAMVCVSAGAALGVGANASGAQQDANWQNAAGGAWSLGANWLEGVSPNNGSPLPADTYRVFIAVPGTPPGTPYTVNLDIDVTIDELNLTSSDATLAFDPNRSLTILGDFTFTGAFVTGGAGGVLDIGGVSILTNAQIVGVPTVNLGTSTTLDASSLISGGAMVTTRDGSSLTLNGGTMMAVTQFTGGVGATITLSGATLMSVGTFTSRGDLFFTGGISGVDDICDTGVGTSGHAMWTGGDIQLNGSSSITNQPGGLFEIRTDGQMLGAMGAPTFLNQGTLVKSLGAGTAALADVAFTNAGTFQVNSGTVAVNDTGSGNGGLVNDGMLDVGAGAVLSVGAGASFTNTPGSGTLSVASSAQATIDAAADFTNFSAGTLTGGAYIVGGTLRFGGTGLTALQDATVCLDGAASDIRRADGSTGIEQTLTAIGGTTTLELLGGRDYTNQSDFTVGNDATLKTGAGSDFMVQAGSQLTNFSAGTLAQGTFDLKGDLRFDTGGTPLSTIDAKVILDGPASDIKDFTRASLLGTLDTIGNAGEFTIRSGRNFTTGGSFTVAATGTLNIETGDTFEVPDGFLLNNISGGVFTDGTFNITGQLIAPNAMITRIDNNVVIRQSGSGISRRDSMNPMVLIDALASLNTIGPTGSLTVLDGASLNLTDPMGLTVLGTLIVGTPPPLRGDQAVLHVAGDLRMGDVMRGARGTLNLQGGRIDIEGGYSDHGGSTVGSGTVRLGVMPPDLGGPRGFGPVTGDSMPIASITGTVSPGDALDSVGAITFEGDVNLGLDSLLIFDFRDAGSPAGFDRIAVTGGLTFGDGMGGPPGGAGTVLLRVKPGFAPSPGQAFDVLTFGSRPGGGGFAVYDGLDLGGGMHFEAELTDSGLRFVVVPAPSPGAAVLLGLLAASRRRR